MSETAQGGPVVAGKTTKKIFQFVVTDHREKILLVTQQTSSGLQLRLPGLKDNGYSPKNAMVEKFPKFETFSIGDRLGIFEDKKDIKVVSSKVYEVKNEIDPKDLIGDKIINAAYYDRSEIAKTGLPVAPITQSVLKFLKNNKVA